MSQSRQLAAIVFTDIAGYTQAMGNDEKYALELLRKNRSITPKVIKEYNGEFLKEMGDGTLSRFSSVIDAVRCAIEIQRQAKDDNLPLRVGVHIGDVIIEDTDVLGSGVNIASRIESLADVGGICISSDVWHQISNQNDLSAESLGIKSLKGVSEKIEVFKLNPSYNSQDSTNEKSSEGLSLFGDLMDRKFPHIVMLYAFLCWGMVSVVRYFVDFYMLSPHLVSFSVFGVASFFPTALLLAYFRGNKGFKNFERIEKIGIPINFVASILLLSIMFSSKDLGSVTKVVTLKDEEGKMLERVVAKAEFVKKIAIFPFDGKSIDEESEWIYQMFDSGISSLLDQDIFIEEIGVSNDLEVEGYTDYKNVPFTLKQEIAKRRQVETFVTGLVSKENNDIVANVQLFDTESGKLLSKYSYAHSSLLELFDLVTSRLRVDIGLPEKHIQESKFLSIRDIATYSDEAFRFLAQGQIELWKNRDLDSGIKYLKKSIEIDPTCPQVRHNLAFGFMLKNDSKSAAKHWNAMIKHIHKLPERTAVNYKLSYYGIFKKDEDKSAKILEMQVEMYPSYKQARIELGEHYSNLNLYDDALVQFIAAHQIDERDVPVLEKISDTYAYKDDFENALLYLNKIVDLQPDNFESYRMLGWLYKYFDFFEKSLEYYERALLMSPNNLVVMGNIGDIKMNIGDFQGALEVYEEMLSLCDTSDDYKKAYEYLKEYYGWLGQAHNAMATIDKVIEYYEKKDLANVNRLSLEGERVHYLVSIGQYEEAEKLMLYINENMIDILKDWVAAEQYYHFGSTTDNLEMLNLSIEHYSVKGVINSGYVEDGLNLTKGEISRIKKEYLSAIGHYKKYLDNNKSSSSAMESIAECYSLLGRNKEAREYMDMALKDIPYDPYYRYKSSLIYDRAGDRQRAIDDIKLSLDIWKDADKDHVDANKARAQWEEWNATAN